MAIGDREFKLCRIARVFFGMEPTTDQAALAKQLTEKIVFKLDLVLFLNKANQISFTTEQFAYALPEDYKDDEGEHNEKLPHMMVAYSSNILKTFKLTNTADLAGEWIIAEIESIENNQYKLITYKALDLGSPLNVDVIPAELVEDKPIEDVIVEDKPEAGAAVMD